MSKPTEDFLTVYADVGETTGWALGKGLDLLASGQTPMWDFSDEFEGAVTSGTIRGTIFGNEVYWRENKHSAYYVDYKIGRLVAEDWRLYPDKLPSLAWDQCWTARLLGALFRTCRSWDIPMLHQPAAIKDRAVKGAAEELFVTPLYENRHQNDAVMHFTYYTQTELLGMHYSGLDNLPGKATTHGP